MREAKRLVWLETRSSKRRLVLCAMTFSRIDTASLTPNEDVVRVEIARDGWSGRLAVPDRRAPRTARCGRGPRGSSETPPLNLDARETPRRASGSRRCARMRLSASIVSRNSSSPLPPAIQRDGMTITEVARVERLGLLNEQLVDRRGARAVAAARPTGTAGCR